MNILVNVQNTISYPRNIWLTKYLPFRSELFNDFLRARSISILQVTLYTPFANPDTLIFVFGN